MILTNLYDLVVLANIKKGYDYGYRIVRVTGLDTARVYRRLNHLNKIGLIREIDSEKGRSKHYEMTDEGDAILRVAITFVNNHITHSGGVAIV